MSLLQLALSGGFGYIWRYSGWDRRGRFLGYAEVIREVRKRIMGTRGHSGAYFYLLTYAALPELGAAEGAAQLGAVVKPVTDRADARAEPCYVEVSDPKDVPFFETHGFAALEGEGLSLFSVPKVTIMVRAPRAV